MIERLIVSRQRKTHPMTREENPPVKARKAIIIGAGPTGLTAAYELLHKTDISPVIYEMSGDIGGISKTIDFKGNRMDIGPHRFFSKSDRVLNFWFSILPLEGTKREDGSTIRRDGTDRIMLHLNRLTRILYRRRFFEYPISLNWNTLKNIGFSKIMKCGFSYVGIRLAPIRKEKSLEDFYINRFGKELYFTFFRDYTEKLWGIPCKDIPATWGIQRVKGVSAGKALIHALRNMFRRGAAGKDTETSLIGSFYYPKFGAGQLYEEMARIIKDKGGELHLHHRVVRIRTEGGRVTAVDVRNEASGAISTIEGELFLSSMPVKELIEAFGDSVPEDAKEVGRNLPYRDFLIVGLLLKRLKLADQSGGGSERRMLTDNWLYIQEPGVKMVRIDLFNNFGGYMVKDKDTIWIGAEYTLNEHDELWKKSDDEMARFAIEELVKIDLVDEEDVMDFTVARMPKAYPAYFGSYERFDLVRDFVDGFDNLFLVGRNGTHKYNNMDHSILTAMLAVENISQGIRDRKNIWDVNTEKAYMEEKQHQE